MKKNDVIRHENKFFVIIEEMNNGCIGCMCINDGELHVFRTYECAMVQSYQKQTKSLRSHLYAFFDWMFSDKLDIILKRYFFKGIKLIFIFCAAATLALVLIKIYEYLNY